MFRISDAIRSTSNQDGSILLDLRRGQILGLNPVGSTIFEMIKRGLNQEEIANTISTDFGIGLDEVRPDVIQFIETLRQHGILQPV